VYLQHSPYDYGAKFNMLDSNQNTVDFRAQADQMMQLIEAKLEMNQRMIALEFMVLKFKTLFEQGVASGRRYEREGVYPYKSLGDQSF
jgi:hypothetical protein